MYGHVDLPRKFSQEGADLLRSERVGAGGHAGEQRVLGRVGHAELLEVSSCLRNLLRTEDRNHVLEDENYLQKVRIKLK